MKNNKSKKTAVKSNRKRKLNRAQIKVFTTMISAKLKHDINNSNIVKRHKNLRNVTIMNGMKHRNFKSVSPSIEQHNFNKNLSGAVNYFSGRIKSPGE